MNADKSAVIPDDVASSARLDAGLNSGAPNIYFNGFSLALGTGDIVLILERNSVPIAIVNSSYTVSKTLAQKLGGLIAHLEEDSGNVIMTTADVQNYVIKPTEQKVSKKL